MKTKLLIYILPVLLSVFLIYGFSSQDDPRVDAAPEEVNKVRTNTDLSKYNLVSQSDTLVPSGFYTTLWNYNYSATEGENGGTVGATYYNGLYFNNRWNNSTLYRINPDGQNGGPGTLADSNDSYEGNIRDMTIAPDGSGTEYLWGGKAGSTLYKLDANGNSLASYVHTGASYRAIAWDPNRKGFWSSNFGGNIVCRDTNGTVLGTLVNTATGKYGMAFDSTSTADSAFLWVWSQQGTGFPNDLYKIHIESNTITEQYVISGTGIAGGAETFIKDNKFILSLNYQNFAIVGYVLKELTPPSSATLVIVHDSVTTSTKRDADRDTLRKYLPSAVGSYDMITVDTSSALPDLSNYDLVILQETSFDTGNRRYLGSGARTQLKAWLASGTPVDKKRLVSIGADQGYNYSRAASNGNDLEFAETYCKFIYRVDSKPGSTSPSVEGTNVDIGNMRDLTSSPPGAGYYADGCSMFAGGVSLYKYQNGGPLDTLAAIGNIEPGYLTATMFQDPRYFAGGFGDVLSSLVNWVNDNNPLPVELASFVASINENDVTLNWSTVSEINNSGFEIERSASADQWTKIGSVEGNGTSNESHSYSYTDRALATGKYSYRLKQIDFNGNFEYYNLDNEVNLGIPDKFSLSQNYPNPFNPSTTIEFALPFDGNAVMTVFDMSGKEVMKLVNEFRTSGYHTVRFDGSSLASGVYFYKLNLTGSNNFTQVKKMVLVK